MLLRMKITVVNNSLDRTLKEVERLSLTYSKDVFKLKDIPLITFFDIVSRQIEYKSDPVGYELVMRPSITLKKGFGDCDDKTILCLAYFIENKIKCGYSIVSERPDKEYHHIFPFYMYNGKMCDFDATYPHYRIGQKFPNFTARKDKIIYYGEFKK